jgi:peptidoglycan-associated lipoprotein
MKVLSLFAVLTLVVACGSNPKKTGPTGASGPVTTRPAPTVSWLEYTDPNKNGYSDRVFFETDQYDLNDQSQEMIQAWARWLQAHPGSTVLVEGHCDERGTREYNLALGARRATAVRNYLIALGVQGSRIRTISYGKERPAVAGSNEEAWARNRRGVAKPSDAGS